MSKQERIEKSAAAPQERTTEEPHAQVPEAVSPEAQALKDELDALLDEVDAVLEENAEEFIANYVQKGGQ